MKLKYFFLSPPDLQRTRPLFEAGALGIFRRLAVLLRGDGAGNKKYTTPHGKYAPWRYLNLGWAKDVGPGSRAQRGVEEGAGEPMTSDTGPEGLYRPWGQGLTHWRA